MDELVERLDDCEFGPRSRFHNALFGDADPDELKDSPFVYGAMALSEIVCRANKDGVEPELLNLFEKIVKLNPFDKENWRYYVGVFCFYIAWFMREYQFDLARFQVNLEHIADSRGDGSQMKSMIEALTGYTLEELRSSAAVAAVNLRRAEKAEQALKKERKLAEKANLALKEERERAEKEHLQSDGFRQIVSDQVYHEVCNAYKVSSVHQRIRDFLASVDFQTFTAIRNLIAQCLSLTDFEKRVDELGRQLSSEGRL